MKNIFKKIGLLIIGLLIMGTILSAQDTTKYTKPSWYFGAAIGANFNFYRGSTQTINSTLISYPAFHNGTGVGLYLAPLVEFHKPDSRFGGMLQIGYDNRKGKFDQVTTPCDCPADLKANVSYLTIEPSFRVQPFKGNFYVYAGPRIALDLSKSFKYDKGASADGTIPADPELKGDFSNVRSSVFSMQIGAGYDIPLSSQDHKTQYVISPFVAVHPYFGQNPRSIETWNVTTVRAGVVIKFGKGHKKDVVQYIPDKPVVVKPPVIVVVPIVAEVPKPIPVVVVAPVEITMNYALYYKFDESNLDNATIKDLDELVSSLKADSTLKVSIKSYADSRGTVDYNISLSQRRGKAVTDYMINKGINSNRIYSQGLGKTIIFDKDNNGKVNESNYALNRRSKIVVSILPKK